MNKSEELVTQNNISSANNNIRKYGNVNLNYYQRLLKKGRNFKAGFNVVLNNFDRVNTQHTFITRNLNTSNPSSREIATFRDEDIHSASFNLRLKFTEPLGGNHYLNTEVNATSLSGKEVTNQSRKTTNTTTVEDFIDFDYKYLQNSLKSRVFHSYNTSKLNIATTLELQNLRREFGQVNDNEFVKEQLYVNPSFFIQYKPRRGKKFRFLFKRIIRAPRPNETNPFINDLNPFFIRTGNVSLQSEKVNSFVTFYNSSDLKSSISFNTKLQYNYSTDAIIRNITIDDDFIRTSSFQNNGERHLLKALANFSKKINKLGVRLSLKNRFFYNSVNSLVNLNLNNLVSQDFSTNFIIQNTRKRKVDLKAGSFYSVNNTSFSIDKDLDRKFTTQKYFGMIDFDITKRFNFNTQLDYIIYNDNNFNIHQELPIWNAAASYSLAKNNHIFKLVLIDLLNKNVDIFRRSTTNFFEETTAQSLGRYIVFSYTFRLNSSSRKKSKKK